MVIPSESVKGALRDSAAELREFYIAFSDRN
jgi:hypothetical protein